MSGFDGLTKSGFNGLTMSGLDRLTMRAHPEPFDSPLTLSRSKGERLAQDRPFDPPLTLSRSKGERLAQGRLVEGCARRVVCVPLLVAFIAASASCGGTNLFRQYEYEEEVYLSLDGTATVYVNSSLAALNALRGTSFDAGPNARVDTAAVRRYYSSAGTRVTRVSPFRRNNRRYVHVQLDVDDIRKLGEAAPFAWSVYRFQRDGNVFVYRQSIDGAAARDVGHVGWNGREPVAFRLHLPSKIRDHNTRAVEGRGNILTWEQPLSERLRGVPLMLEARMDPQSILYRTLWLFGVTFLAVASAFGAIIWWVMRRGDEMSVT